MSQLVHDEVFDDVTLPEPDRRATRHVFLITYSQADPVYTKQSFADLVLRAIRETGQNCVVEKWVCAKERHRNGGHHFHMSVKLQRQRRWLQIKEFLLREFDMSVHFSNKQKEGKEISLYDGAYWYTVKGNDFIVSEGHPEVKRPDDEEEEEAKLTNMEFMRLIVQMELRTVLQVQATAKRNIDASQEALYAFLANKSKQRIAELVETAWEIEEAPAKQARLESDRIQILRDCETEACTCTEPLLWQHMANQVLQLNGIGVDSYSQAVLAALTLGRGKFRNILHVGETNRAKTFLIQPLKLIYNAFNNPSRATFNWIGVDTAEVILLNDFRWGKDILPWEQILLLLEGDIVKFPAPKNKYGADIELSLDTPIFATSRAEIEFQGGSASPYQIEQENAMMRSRWKTFHFTHEFTENSQVNCPPCKHCYAGFIFCSNVDLDSFDDPIN